MIRLKRTGLCLLCGTAAAIASLLPLTAGEAKADAPGPKGELVVEDDLSQGLENWVWVGPPGSVVEMEDGALLLDPREANHREPGVEGINVWFRRPLERGDWAIEFDVEPLQPRPADREPCNLLFMLDYRPLDGEPEVLEEAPQQTGHYALLHGVERGVEAVRKGSEVEHQPMSGYTITYYRINHEADPPYMMIVRRNPGFHLVHREVQTAADQWPFLHTVRIERRGGDLKLYQDGKLTLEALDTADELLPRGGHFGFRTWKTRVKLHGVRAYRLDP